MRGMASETIDLYFSSLSGGERGGTHRTYDTGFNAYRTVCRALGKGPLNLTPIDIADVAARLRATKTAGYVKVVCTSAAQLARVLYPNEPLPSEDSLLSAVRKGLANVQMPGERKKREAKNHPWFSLSGVFERMRAIDTLTCTEQQLRDKAIVLLAIDLAARANDITRVMRTSLRFSDTALQLTFANTKTSRGARVSATVQAHATDPRVCTVHTLRTWEARFPRRPTDVASVDSEGAQYHALFPQISTATAAHLPREVLTPQRVAKVIAAALPPSPSSKRWTAQNVRGAASSKWANLGALPATVMAQGRWTTYQMFAKNYHRRVLYTNQPPNAATMSTADLARWPGVRAPV
jgi:hypothetical protein